MLYHNKDGLNIQKEKQKNSYFIVYNDDIYYLQYNNKSGVEKNMNKEELLSLVESLSMPKDEYYILGGGSLVMFGIKDKTADLDLCVSEELFARLKEEYNLNEEDKNECGFYHISDINAPKDQPYIEKITKYLGENKK